MFTGTTQRNSVHAWAGPGCAEMRHILITIACNRIDTPAASVRRSAFALLRRGERSGNNDASEEKRERGR